MEIGSPFEKPFPNIRHNSPRMKIISVLVFLPKSLLGFASMRALAKTTRTGRRVNGTPLFSMRVQANFDSGDHLHPNDAGYKVMADSIDLQLLTKPN